MLEIEEVIINDNEAEYDNAEYLNEARSSVAPPPAANIKIKVNLPKGITVKRSSSPPSVTQNGKPGSSSTVRKTPIIRKAGEVVTPNQKPSAVVAVSPSTLQMPAPLRTPKTEWAKVTPPGLKIPLSSITKTEIISEVQQDPEDDDDDVMEDYTQDDDEAQGLNDTDEQYDYAMPDDDPGSTDMASIHSKLTRIERLLKKVVAKQGHHDEALKTLKFNMSDLRAGLNKAGGTSKTTNPGNTAIRIPVPIKRDRKRLVVFPVADDNYLLRLDDLVGADDEIRTDLIALFAEAPKNSAYEFQRKNVQALFAHTSKYTWTGKMVHNVPNVPASNPANKLAIVELLISCACDTFPHLGRDVVEKEFRRALANFNESRVVRMKRNNTSNKTAVDDGENSGGLM